MASAKSIVKTFVLIISGIAIVVVGGFMMGAIARLWSPKETRNKKNSKPSDSSSDTKKAD